jgi:hypothetical protein
VTPEQEVRSAAICCPSCGGNLADLMKTGHRMALVVIADGLSNAYAECRDGQRLQLDTLPKVQAAYNLAAAEGWLWGT